MIDTGATTCIRECLGACRIQFCGTAQRGQAATKSPVGTTSTSSLDKENLFGTTWKSSLPNFAGCGRTQNRREMKRFRQILIGWQPALRGNGSWRVIGDRQRQLQGDGRACAGRGFQLALTVQVFQPGVEIQKAMAI